MRAALPYVIAVVLALAVGLAIWQMMGKTATAGTEGFPAVCGRSDCGHFFKIPYDEADTWPRGSSGEGFKCDKCGQFGARIGVQCAQCKQWFAPKTEGTRGESVCPKCSPPAPKAGRQQA